MINNNLKYDLKESLQGKVLIATPSIADNRFYRSVIVMANHNSNGALGIVINKPSAHQFSHILKSIQADFDETKINIGSQKISITLGGPVNLNNLFILHTSDYNIKETAIINEKISMSNQPQIVYDIASNNGPKTSIIGIGCSTWTAGQLEKELQTDTWIICEYDHDKIFETHSNQMYEKFSAEIGLPLGNNMPFFVPVSKRS